MENTNSNTFPYYKHIVEMYRVVSITKRGNCLNHNHDKQSHVK